MASERDAPVPGSNAYPLPLYLNQKYVFDVLAMMEGGFTQLESVTSSTEENQEKAGQLSGGVGFENVFGLLSVTLGGARSRQDRSSESQQISAERVHTPNSLFARMRERLWEEGRVGTLMDDDPAPGDFVELTMRLEKNPLVESLETLHSILRMGAIFDEPPARGPKQQAGRKRQATGPESEASRLIEQMNDLMHQLNTGEVVDLLATPVESVAARVVLTLDTTYAVDASLSDLIDGEYRVLGKVTRFLAADSGEKINLLRKTTLGRIQGELLEGLNAPFAAMSASGIALPRLHHRGRPARRPDSSDQRLRLKPDRKHTSTRAP